MHQSDSLYQNQSQLTLRSGISPNATDLHVSLSELNLSCSTSYAFSLIYLFTLNHWVARPVDLKFDGISYWVLAGTLSRGRIGVANLQAKSKERVDTCRVCAIGCLNWGHIVFMQAQFEGIFSPTLAFVWEWVVTRVDSLYKRRETLPLVQNLFSESFGNLTLERDADAHN